MVSAVTYDIAQILITCNIRCLSFATYVVLSHTHYFLRLILSFLLNILTLKPLCSTNNDVAIVQCCHGDKTAITIDSFFLCTFSDYRI